MTYTLFCQIPPICRKSQNAQTISIFAILTQSPPKKVLRKSSTPLRFVFKRCFASPQLRYASYLKVLRKSSTPLRYVLKRCFASPQLRYASYLKVLRKSSTPLRFVFKGASQVLNSATLRIKKVLRIL